MTLLLPWVVFPALLVVLSLGCGLVLEEASALRLPTPLLLPAGFAVVALVAQFGVLTDATAKLAVPAVVAAAVAGFALAVWRRGVAVHLPDRWSSIAGVGAYAAYAAPVVLSGSATFAGYIKLDDDSTLVALVDRVMEHGRSLAHVEPSTYFRVLDTLLDEGYPLASLLPLGIGHTLTGQDELWLYQPTMAFMAAMLALALYQLAGEAIAYRWWRVGIAVVASQSALLFGYALWGGIKELGTAWALPLLAALVPGAVASTRHRHLLPLAAASALLLGVLNAGAIVWLAPALLVALVLIVRERGLRGAVPTAAAFTGFLVLLSLPTIVAARAFLTSNIVSYDPLANLVAPLDPLQIGGIWPGGDFRFAPMAENVTRVLIVIAMVAAAATVVWTARRRPWPVPLYVVGAVASAVVLWAASTPWIEAKAFATASPAIPFGALVAAGLLLRGGRVVEGAVLATIVAGGVLWSNVLQYHDAWLAPHGQLAELEHVGSRYAGDGPALMTEYEPYGARHLLRRLDAEGASELRVRPVSLTNGQQLQKGAYANIDDFALDGILVYRTLVLRRSPVESRPPSPYRLVSKGRWYEVWQRPEAGGRTVLEHLSLGTDAQPSAVPRCADVLRLAARAGAGGALAAVVRPAAVVANLSPPDGWGVDASGGLIPAGPGTVEATLDVPTAGRYGLWLGGSFRDGLDVFVDGRRISSARNQLNNAGQYNPLGEVELARGRHSVQLRYGGPDAHPGSGGPQFAMGPLVLSTVTADLPVTYVEPRNARQLCGRRLDWVEALG